MLRANDAPPDFAGAIRRGAAGVRVRASSSSPHQAERRFAHREPARAAPGRPLMEAPGRC
jgi:hypothetical protein